MGVDAAEAAAVDVFALRASVALHRSLELRTRALAHTCIPPHAGVREEAGFAAQEGRRDLAADDGAALRGFGVAPVRVPRDHPPRAT
eukprot:2085456-Alexandrium_andersonii.AAC.1